MSCAAIKEASGEMIFQILDMFADDGAEAPSCSAAPVKLPLSTTRTKLPIVFKRSISHPVHTFFDCHLEFNNVVHFPAVINAAVIFYRQVTNISSDSCLRR